MSENLEILEDVLKYENIDNNSPLEQNKNEENNIQEKIQENTQEIKNK